MRDVRRDREGEKENKKEGEIEGEQNSSYTNLHHHAHCFFSIVVDTGKYGVRDRDDGKSGTVFWFAFPYRPDFTASPTSPFNEMVRQTQPFI